MKLPYKTVLNVVRYCHQDYWRPLPDEDEFRAILLAIPCIFSGNIHAHSCYPSWALLKYSKNAYATDVQAAISEMEMGSV